MHQTPNRVGLPVILTPPKHPDTICTNRASTSFPAIAGAKYAQDLPYGAPEWQRVYATARNVIEGTNGYLKDHNHHALAAPDRRRMRGYAAQYLLVAVLVAAANLRKISDFLRLQHDPTEKPPPVRRRGRRPQHSPLHGYKPVPLATGDPPEAA